MIALSIIIRKKWKVPSQRGVGGRADDPKTVEACEQHGRTNPEQEETATHASMPNQTTLDRTSPSKVR
jgi:hypothetical protein